MLGNLKYFKIKIGESERVIDIEPTMRGEKALLFMEDTGEWIPYEGDLDCRGAQWLSHEELGNLDRVLKENQGIRQRQFGERGRAKRKDWRGAIGDGIEKIRE